MRPVALTATFVLGMAALGWAQTSPDPVGAAIEALTRGKTTAARSDAARALGASRNARALEPLVAVLKDANRDVRWAAIEALGDLGDRRAVPALVEYLKRPEAYRWGKRLVADALGAIGDPSALDGLVQLLADEDPFARRLAALAMLRLGDAGAAARVATLLAKGDDETLGAVRREYVRAEEERQQRILRLQARPAAATAPTVEMRSHEWAGLKAGGTPIAKAREQLGMPLQETKEFLLYRGNRLAGAFAADSVVLNVDAAGVIESIFVFPVWGTMDRDVRAALGTGKLAPYAEFLKVSGRTAYGAGTRAGGKLHYVPPDVMTESYAEMGMLVVYDGADVAVQERLVKLIIVY